MECIMKKQCFIIQPFNDKYNDYYEAIFQSAILNAGLEPYRVDEDLAKRTPIESIEKEIRESVVCFAEITENNPNVWYELGFAFACEKDVVMVCAESRNDNYPFDIRHKDILKYKSESPKDHQVLSKKITQKLIAYAKSQKAINKIKSSSVPENSEFNERELLFLSLLLSNIIDPSEGVLLNILKESMDKVSESNNDYILALKKLLKSGFVELQKDYDYNNNSFTKCNITEKGDDWVISNQESLIITQNDCFNVLNEAIDEDDIPF